MLVNRVLVVDKPSGMTSHDVVARVRRSSRQRKVGHTGTLDPAATGILIVLVGKATRLAQFFVDAEKEYRGSMILGVSTDTQDAQGSIVSTSDPGGIGEGEVLAAFARFRGAIEQVPPMVSALKRDGTPLYVLARRGEVVEREARSVEVRELKLLAFDPPRVEFEVACSRGTYVRTLASDVGDALGCGAHLERLRRTRIGRFGLDDALTLEEIERLREGVAEAGMSMFEALSTMPVVLVAGGDEETISTGGAIAFDGEGAGEGDLVRVTADGSELLAVGRVTGGGSGDRRVQPVRVFAELG